MRLEADEAYRVIRVRLALHLGCLPSQIDQASMADIKDVLAVMEVDERLAKKQSRKSR